MTLAVENNPAPLHIENDPVPLRIDQDGVVRVSDTRVTLDTIIGTFLMDVPPEEIAERYPSVPLADVYAVISYYLRHEPAVTAYLQARAALAEEVRKKVEARWSPEGVRERLLARRAVQQTEADAASGD